MAITSFLYGAFIFLYKIFHGIDVAGWVPMMVILTFTAGLQMCMLGVLGEYLWRTLDESRKRPSFVIDEIYKAPLIMRKQMNEYYSHPNTIVNR